MKKQLNLKKKSGFTLIELMIVLAIIAILAVVLIPKSQIFKGQSKNAGVTTNVNTVRGYLETKVSDNGGASEYLDTGALGTQIGNNFGLASSSNDGVYSPSGSSTEEQLINPFGKDKASVKIVDKSSSALNEASTSDTGVDGEVIIQVYSDGYAVYGVDKGSAPTQLFKVK
ncbi:type II secretion system protein [Clostridium sp. Mt-5]|uniref:Type II secretion system protein n=1 Tax=Clostridium moutaii TaxID=3240932 RepID=A0ABV4BM79_9CLOT